MPRIAKRKRSEHQLTITLTFTGSLFDAYDAARRALDQGAIQDAMQSWSTNFKITSAEVK